MHLVKLPAKYRNMNEPTAVVIGATGLTGSLLVQDLLNDKFFKVVRILVRKPVRIAHQKLQQQIVDFNNMDDYSKNFGEGDIIFCCIGTTQKKVKNDKIAYEKIDFDIPLNAARIGLDKGFKKFLIVSAIGADEKSSNFYLRLKGRTENALAQLPFESVDIFRPSILLGKRNEYRLAEKIIQAITEIFSFIFFGMLRKYHPIDAKNVAKAMIAKSKIYDRGVHFYDYEGIMKLAEED